METTFFLTGAEYYGEKKQVVAEFSNAHERRIQRFDFHPKAFFKAGNTGLFMEVLGLYDEKKFEAKPVGGEIVEVKAAEYDSLKKISRLAEKATGRQVGIIEPERQFLCEKKWGYFDSFKKTHLGFEKTGGLKGIPDCIPRGMAVPVAETAEFLAKNSGKQDAIGLLEKIVWSSIARIPLEKIPVDADERTACFAENSFFENSTPVGFSRGKEAPEIESHSRGYFEGLAEIDLSPILADCFVKHNIGFGSTNCMCCKPGGIHAPNILPGSMAGVSFSCDSLYFESSSPLFAREFHEASPGKAERLERQGQWSLRTAPVGPSKRNKTIMVPLEDAKRLCEKGTARLSGETSLDWGCVKKKGFCSLAIESLQARFLEAEEKIVSMEKTAFSRGINSAGELETPNYLMGIAKRNAVAELLRHAPKQFAALSGSRAARAYSEIRARTMLEFSEFARKSGKRVVLFEKDSALVQEKNPLSIATSYSSSLKRPLPGIRATNRAIAFG